MFSIARMQTGDDSLEVRFTTTAFLKDFNSFAYLSRINIRLPVVYVVHPTM